MKIYKYSVLLISLLLFPMVARAYTAKYKLDGRFFVETFNSKSKQKGLEIWDIFLQQGLVDGKEAFIDFNIVALELRSSGKGKHRISDIDIRCSGEETKLSFLNDTFIAEWGITVKWVVRINFNEDGSLQSMSGSKTDLFQPENVTIYSLVTKEMKLRIDEINKFPKKGYAYERR